MRMSDLGPGQVFSVLTLCGAVESHVKLLHIIVDEIDFVV